MPGSLTTTNDASGKPVHVVTGGGSDIWGASDNFYYAYFMATNNFDYVVKVAGHIGNSGDGGWSKAELMARVPDDSGAPQGGDPFIANMANRPTSDTANGAPAGVNNRGPQWRSIRDNQCSWTTPSPAYPPNADHNWLRLERDGNVIYMYTSDDGKAWHMYNPYDPQGWDTSGSWPPGADNAAVAFFSSAWPSTVMLGLAVTAHNDADFSTVVFSDFGPYTPTPVAIGTQPVAKLAISANSALTLSVAATGDPVHYEWFKDGKAILKAVNPTYKVALAKVSDAGTYKVRVYGGGKEIMSTESVVTVTVDNTPPTLVSANSSASFNTLTLKFSEPVTSATAQTVANYKLTGGVTITAATLQAAPNDDTVALTTSKQTEGTTLTLTVNNIKDTAGNIIAANTTKDILTFKFATGFADYSRWNYTADPGGIQVLIDALNDGSMRAPDIETAVTQFGGPWGVADNYFARVFGFFVPPSNGNYVFFVSGDDQVNLYLSTDADPANKKLIAQEGGWSNQYQWTTPGSGDAATKTLGSIHIN